MVEDGWGRNETPEERLDRNWGELLQELRVTQTGVQLIAGFLLTLPFQQRFAELDEFQTGTYLALVLLSTGTIALTLAPVAIHRRLFRRRIKARLVLAAHRITQAALAAIALLMAGIVLLVFDVVVGRPTALATAAAALVVTIGLLLVLPFSAARDTGPSMQEDQ